MVGEYYIQETDNYYISFIPSRIICGFGYFYNIFNKKSQQMFSKGLVKINCPYCRGTSNDEHNIDCPLK